MRVVTALLAIALGASITSAEIASVSNAVPSEAITASTLHLKPPSCTTATDDGPPLSSVRVRFLPTNGSAFGVAVSPSSDTGYVAQGNDIQIVENVAGTPRSSGVLDAQGDGLAITPDGRFLLAANGSMLQVSSTSTSASIPSSIGLGDGLGGIEVTVTPNGRFAFVSLENSQAIAVIRLTEKGDQLRGSEVGTIPVGPAPVGLAVSPDGKWLYSTSEGGGSLGGDQGSLRVIDVARAESDPSASVVETVDAGCEPVRVVTSGSGATVWVTARASDALLAYSATSLRSDPAHALIADVRVGEAPVGLTVARGGARIVVADSNRFDAPGAEADLLVVNTTAALTGKPAVLGHIASGLFPRDMATTRDDKAILVSNYESNQLEIVPTVDLP
jgi:DNA-binding beta-propeller fold protein YncE